MSSAENDKPTDVRLVPMTRAQRDRLSGWAQPDSMRALAKAWNAAPADPTEAVRDALIQSTDLPADERRLAIAVVLAALGVPT